MKLFLLSFIIMILSISLRANASYKSFFRTLMPGVSSWYQKCQTTCPNALTGLSKHKKTFIVLSTTSYCFFSYQLTKKILANNKGLSESPSQFKLDQKDWEIINLIGRGG